MGFSKNNNLYETEFINIKDYDGSIKIKMNSQDRDKNQNILYFTKYNLSRYHNSCITNNGIFVYSFSLEPEIYQPKGFCNVSGLNNLSMELNNVKIFNIISFKLINTNSDYTITSFDIEDESQIENLNISIFAINYNIFKVLNGMGSVVYVN